MIFRIIHGDIWYKVCLKYYFTGPTYYVESLPTFVSFTLTFVHAGTYMKILGQKAIGVSYGHLQNKKWNKENG